MVGSRNWILKQVKPRVSHFLRRMLIVKLGCTKIYTISPNGYAFVQTLEKVALLLAPELVVETILLEDN
jgi:hypothetical protein